MQEQIPAMLDCTCPKSVRRQAAHDERNYFIISNSQDKLSPAARKLIRSQVMRGKNRRRVASPVDPGTWINRELEPAQDSSIVSCPQKDLSGSGLATIRYAEPMQPYMYDLIWTCKPPSPVPTGDQRVLINVPQPSMSS